VATESTNTQNGFHIKKIVPVTTIPKLAAFFFLNTCTLPIAAGLSGESPYLQPSVFRAGSNEVLRAIAPHAFVSSH